MTTKEAILNKDATLLDIRNSDELETDGFIDSATHIPMFDLPLHLEQIKEMSKPIVVFCRSGARATRAIEYLNDQGITDLYNGGGYEDIINIKKEAEL